MWSRSLLQGSLCVLALAGCGEGRGTKPLQSGEGGDGGEAIAGLAGQGDGIEGEGASANAGSAQGGALNDAAGAGGAELGGAASGAGGAELGGAAPDCLSDPAPTPAEGECPASLTDSRNCGACGVDCGDGWCDEGVCRTLTHLAEGLTWPSSVAVSQLGVLLLTKGPALEAQGQLSSLALECPLQPQAVASDLIEPDTLTVGPQGLYWFAREAAEPGASLMLLQPGDEAASPLVSALDEPGYQIAFDASFVYLPIQGVPPAFLSGGGIFRCELAGCLEAGPTLLASGEEYYRPTGVLVHEGTLYWTIQGTLPAFVDGKVLACASDDCAATTTTIYDGARGPRSLALRDDYLYWVEEGTGPTYKDGAVRRCNPDDCQASAAPVLSNLGRPFKLVVDGEFAFAAEQLGGYGIVRAPVEGGAARRLATTNTPVSSVAVDQDYVYFTEVGDGAATGALLRVHR